MNYDAALAEQQIKSNSRSKYPHTNTHTPLYTDQDSCFYAV